MDKSDINILMILTGALLIFTILLNLPWIEVYTVSPAKPIFRLELTPYNLSMETAGEIIFTPELGILNKIYMFYLLILGGLAVSSGLTYGTDLGFLVFNTVRNKIVYIVAIFVGLLVAVFLYTILVGIISIYSVDFLSFTIDLKIPGNFIGVTEGEILIPLKLRLGTGLVTSVVAAVLSSMSSRIKREIAAE